MSDTVTLPRRLAQKALNDLLAYWEPNATTEALKAALSAPQTRSDGMPTSKTERTLRRMLCAQRHGTTAYMDDGEASWGGGNHQKATDYMRETPEQIQRAWIDAGLKEFGSVAPEPQPVKQADDFTIRGQLTTLKCWHRLTEAEADDLIVFTAMLTGAKP